MLRPWEAVSDRSTERLPARDGFVSSWAVRSEPRGTIAV